MPTLRGICFPPVMNASGARGFFGEGYWYHGLWSLAGLSFKNCGFTAKTMTLHPRAGNMPMETNGITPKDWFPKCIVAKPITGVALNAVGLSNQGAATLLATLMSHKLSVTHAPFFLSFMAVEKTIDERLQELREFVRLLAPIAHGLGASFGLEINVSCPNAGKKMDAHHPAFAEELWSMLDIAQALEIPLQIKLNALASIPDIYIASKHPACDALVMGNTIPWGCFSNRIDWDKLFGSSESPLKHLGGGGLSGWPLRAIHREWIQNARTCGITKPIWGCGGIDSPQAVDEYARAGANGIQFGTVCMLRPWQVQPIIKRAYDVF